MIADDPAQIDIIYWNVHGFGNFLNFMLSSKVKPTNIFCLTETWLDSECAFDHFMLQNYTVLCSPAIKTNTKGRNKGGILIILDKNIFTCKLIFSSQRILAAEIKSLNISFVLINVYISPDECYENLLNELSETMQFIYLNFCDKPIIVGGDFNAHVGNLNQLDENRILSEYLSATRQSYDTKLDKKGQMLTEFMEMNFFVLLNGRSHSDTPANLTFTSKQGSSVIDLI